jgi:hypothetical protein
VLALVLVIVVAPRPVLSIHPRVVLVAILVLDLLRAVGDEVSRLAALEALKDRYGEPERGGVNGSR